MISLKYFVYFCVFVTPSILAYRRIKYNGADLIFAEASETIDVVCEREVPLVRCGFTHPNGTKVLFVDVVPGTPSCKFTTDATTSETGLWTCHLWTTSQEEIQKTVEVRVVDKFAALDREVVAREGERVTLSCVSSEGMFPLNECYFTSPQKQRIHMDDKITEESMVFNKFFYPRNLSIHRGDCSITLLTAELTDDGTWTCTSWLELENQAYTDFIQLRVQGAEVADTGGKPYVIRLISISTFITGTIICLFIFVVLFYCKRYTRFYNKWEDDDSLESYGMTADPTQILVRENK